MAYFSGKDFDPISPSESEENSETDIRFSYSYSPRALGSLLNVRSSPCLMQDSEESVELQTEDVFLNYMHQSFHLEAGHSKPPSAQDLLGLSRNPLTPAAEVGRRLAHLGDKLSKRYSDELDSMVSSVCEYGDDAYETFAGIARSVFAGGIQWNRILILLNFGYRLAFAQLQHTAYDFSASLSRIVSFMVKFIVSEKIAQWIARNGGWVAAINFVPGTSSSAFFIISGLAAFTVLAVIIGHKFL